ncbi:hypothetical protein FSPOR_7585 [Fusarium sporotrichioides]|uniref:Uncharacterized protein n=1 Tax=Fusarium sporotrichioides TaxID=5514 RepID=A0A395RY04_FUSSP|nr:hypothetical protein FSPOR_7585 [Fusarium sporotrichioides]
MVPTGLLGGESYWQAVNNEASTTDCASISGTKTYFKSNDVSGKKTGFRCKGKGCGFDGNPNDIEELEMNFGRKGETIYHFTLCESFRQDDKWFLAAISESLEPSRWTFYFQPTL